MKTYRDVVYLILDSLKDITDDGYWEADHIVAQINKYRSLLFKQRYLDRKKEIPNVFYQRLTVGFEVNESFCVSTKKIPGSIDNGIINTYTYLQTPEIGGNQINIVTPQRFKTLGYNKWLNSIVYGTIDYDGYMYLKRFSSPNTLEIESAIYDTILDNPIDADRFNDTNTLDILDIEFPCDDSLMQSIIELVISEIAKLNGLPKDMLNNANDDVSIGSNKVEK